MRKSAGLLPQTCRLQLCTRANPDPVIRVRSPVARPARFPPFLVGEHAGENDVGQAPFKSAHGHHRGHAAGRRSSK